MACKRFSKQCWFVKFVSFPFLIYAVPRSQALRCRVIFARSILVPSFRSYVVVSCPSASGFVFGWNWRHALDRVWHTRDARSLGISCLDWSDGGHPRQCCGMELLHQGRPRAHPTVGLIISFRTQSLSFICTLLQLGEPAHMLKFLLKESTSKL